jgi:hypothetical protein
VHNHLTGRLQQRIALLRSSTGQLLVHYHLWPSTIDRPWLFYLLSEFHSMNLTFHHGPRD